MAARDPFAPLPNLERDAAKFILPRDADFGTRAVMVGGMRSKGPGRLWVDGLGGTNRASRICLTRFDRQAALPEPEEADDDQPDDDEQGEDYEWIEPPVWVVPDPRERRVLLRVIHGVIAVEGGTINTDLFACGVRALGLDKLVAKRERAHSWAKAYAELATRTTLSRHQLALAVAEQFGVDWKTVEKTLAFPSIAAIVAYFVGNISAAPDEAPHPFDALFAAGIEEDFALGLCARMRPYVGKMSGREWKQIPMQLRWTLLLLIEGHIRHRLPMSEAALTALAYALLLIQPRPGDHLGNADEPRSILTINGVKALDALAEQAAVSVGLDYDDETRFAKSDITRERYSGNALTRAMRLAMAADEE